MKVPAENIILEEGLDSPYDTQRRATGIRPSTRVVEELSTHLASWGKTRHQWGREIGEHEADATSSRSWAVDTSR